MNPFAFLIIFLVFILVLFLITNVLYPFLNKDVEFFWFLKKDWLERSKDLKKRRQKDKKKSDKN